MLEPPAISDTAIVTCLQSEYGLQDVSLAFLPLGADQGSASFRATKVDGGAYFVKLRLGDFDERAALLPHWLAEQGISEVMAPLPARSGRPWSSTPEFTLLLYPFVEGRDAYEAVLTDEQWVAFGKAMRAIHDAVLPPALADRVPHETFNPRLRNELRRLVAQLEELSFADSVAEHLATFLAKRRTQVLDLVERTERLAQALQGEAPQYVLCHTDLHAGNLLLAADGPFFIVDWDAPLLAPRERDLMYPGGGQGFAGRGPDEEEALFYRGYGPLRVDVRALAYYRFERIIEDLAIFCEQLFRTTRAPQDGAQVDRRQALRWAVSNFEPGGVLDVAYRTANRAQSDP